MTTNNAKRYSLKKKKTAISDRYDGYGWTLVHKSGRRDLNPGLLAPKASALAGLRYAPNKAV